MKGQQRAIYMKLSGLINGEACSFCRFAEWEGTGCCEAECVCEHPLKAVQRERENGPIDDCWGFRPHKGLSVSDIADIVGIVLANGWENWSYSVSDPIEVSGSSPSDRTKLTLPDWKIERTLRVMINEGATERDIIRELVARAAENACRRCVNVIRGALWETRGERRTEGQRLLDNLLAECQKQGLDVT